MRRRTASGLLALVFLWATAATADVSYVGNEPDSLPAVYLEADPSAPANRLWLNVVVEGAEDLYGVSFELRYPDRILKFLEEETTEGPLLASGPVEEGEEESAAARAADEVDTVLAVRRRSPKRILVGLSRMGDVEGVSGDGVLMTLVFQPRAGLRGRGKFRWDVGDLVDSTGWVMPDVQFVRGTAVVTPGPPAAPTR